MNAIDAPKTTFIKGYKLWPKGYKADAPRETRITKTGVFSAEWRLKKKEEARCQH